MNGYPKIVIFWLKNSCAKTARKMLMKLTIARNENIQRIFNQRQGGLPISVSI